MRKFGSKNREYKYPHIDVNGVLHKECRYCKQLLSLSKYSSNANSVDGLTNFCKMCQQIKSKVTKEELILYKGSMCSGCGLKYDGNNSCVFDFHHIEPREKNFKISRSVTSYPKSVMYEEVNKCILLCSNCHRMVHKKEVFA